MIFAGPFFRSRIYFCFRWRTILKGGNSKSRKGGNCAKKWEIRKSLTLTLPTFPLFSTIPAFSYFSYFCLFVLFFVEQLTKRHFVTKLRSRLHDSTIDALWFIENTLQKHWKVKIKSAKFFSHSPVVVRECVIYNRTSSCNAFIIVFTISVSCKSLEIDCLTY